MVFNIGAACSRPAVANDVTVPDPAPAEGVEVTDDSGTASAVFAGGCFWCTEAVFEAVKGVGAVVSGYAGGAADDANYQLVSAGATEHAEAIRIDYDPEQTSFGELLKIFFTVAHDPTQLNRQGPARGKQYRSAAFYMNDAQKQTTANYIAELDRAGLYSDPIVTTLEPLTVFHEAEGYHQDYVKANPGNGYVVVNALPKVEKLREKYPDKVAEDTD